MKISKVNRTRTAVGVKEGVGAKGILYTDPCRGEAPMNIRKEVERRADATKVLFTAFREVKKTKNGKTDEADAYIPEGAGEVAKAFNRAVRTYVMKEKTNRNGRRKRVMPESVTADMLVKALKQTGTSATAGDIEDAMRYLLKRSLSREQTKESLRRIFHKAFGIDANAVLTEDFPKAFLDDYNKVLIKTQTVRALENQNLVVQPATQGEEKVFTLAPTCSSGEKKTREKDALRAFLTAYAVIDEKKRQGMRVKLRRLTDLFFYGEEGVIREDFDEWKQHTQRAASAEPFVQLAPYEKPEGDGKEAQNARKEKLRKWQEEANPVIRDAIIACYRNSIRATENDSSGLYFEEQGMNAFWIHYMEQATEKLLAKPAPEKTFKFRKGYVSEKVWKGIINHLSIKYVAVGKAVYHFCMEELSKEEGDIRLGTMDKGVEDGLSSFAYERIKAEETLQRETAVYVAFAANHLRQATMRDVMTKNGKEETDMLLLYKDDLKVNAKPKILRNILQFFGGQSAWGDFFAGKDEAALLFDLKQILYSMRNESFHFDTRNTDEGSWDTGLIGAMFAKDCEAASAAQKNMYYINNLPMFYPAEALERVFHAFYDSYHERASQVPSFNTVFVRKNFRSYLAANGMQVSFPDEEKLKWENALYYLYKEAYYNAFLPSPEAKKLFLDAVHQLKNGAGQNPKAAEDFVRAVDDCNASDPPLSAICHFITTEFNRQNNNRKKKTDLVADIKPDIFKHYKLFFKMVLQQAFRAFIGAHTDVFGFLKTPRLPGENGKMPRKDFLPDYVSGQYRTLAERVRITPELQKWYITARLLNRRQVTHFAGCLRSYVQYVQNVERRAKETGNPLRERPLRLDVNAVIRVLDLCTKVNGVISREITDYFDDADDYAAYLDNFVEFGGKEAMEAHGASALLAAFCDPDGSVFAGQEEQFYHNGTNPILTRNILQTKLYGTVRICAGAVPRVGEKDLSAYFEAKKGISAYRASGICTDKEEQKRLKSFQELKYRVELLDIVEYSEILTELYGQMINLCYLRERDLMYFQLGFHYLSLHNRREEKPQAYRSFTEDGKKIDGAILRQIAGMYINGIPVRTVDENGVAQSVKDAKAGTGSQIESFFKYTEALYPEGNRHNLYLAGLELFENIAEHADVVDLRNEIDHFRYFSNPERSMLDLYSEIFDRLFTYDMKYRKNIPNMLYNILLSHFVQARFTFGSGRKKVGKAEKDRATLMIQEKEGLQSDDHTYKLGDGTTVKLPAKSKTFLKHVAYLLYYPQTDPVTDEMIYEKQQKEKAWKEE